MLQADARGDQAQLAVAAGFGEVVQAGPELLGRDVQVLDRDHQVAHQAAGDGLDARVAFADDAGGLEAVQQLVDGLGVHGLSLSVVG